MELQQRNILEALANCLKCSICFEIFKDPVTSSCGKHNYCMQCLKSHYEGKVRNCPSCRETFHKNYKPHKNVTLCDIVDIENLEYILACNVSDYEDIPFVVKNPDGSRHNAQALKRKLTYLTSEIKKLDDILSTTFLHPQETLDNVTNSLGVGLECLNSALSQLEQMAVHSMDVDPTRNVGERQGEQLPAETATAACQQHADSTSELPVTAPLQPEGGPSESHSDSQSASMELEAGAEEAGPSTGQTDCLECLSFSPHLGHKGLVFSQNNRKVEVWQQGRAPRSRRDHFDSSQVMADKEFTSGVHYWEVNTADSTGWAIGVAYPTLGRAEKLGRTRNSWCLEWSSDKLCFWHDNKSEHLKHRCPSKIRVSLDMDDSSLAFHSMSDHMILLHNVKVQFALPVRPGFWLYGLKPGNALSFIMPEVDQDVVKDSL